MKLSTANIKTIAIFRALQLGDLLCSMPAFQVLRNSYPNAKISLIGLPNSQALLERFHETIDELIVFPGYPGLPEQNYDLNNINAFIKEMQHRSFDLLLQMQGDGTIVNELCANLKSKNLAGFYPRSQKMDNPLFIPYPNFGHESQRHLKLLKNLDLDVNGAEMYFPINDKDIEDFKKLNLPLSKSSYVCLHPGSRDSARQWPVENFAMIANQISKRGYTIVLTGTIDESEIVHNVESRLNSPAHNLVGKTNLGSLACLLKKSAGLVSNCTGISHISAALKVPSVVISMDGEPQRWGPENKSLHFTHDWINNQNIHLISQAVDSMLTRLPNASLISN